MIVKNYIEDHPNRDKVIKELICLAGANISEEYEVKPRDRRLYSSYSYRTLIRPLVLNMSSRMTGKRRNLLAIATKYKTKVRVIEYILNTYENTYFSVSDGN